MLWIKTVFNLLIPDYAGHVLKSERLVHCPLQALPRLSGIVCYV